MNLFIVDEPDHGNNNCGAISSSLEFLDYPCHYSQYYMCEAFCKYLNLEIRWYYWNRREINNT